MAASVSHYCYDLPSRLLTSAQFSATSYTPNLQMHQKMMAYDRVISELTSSRIGGVSYPIVHHLLDATRATGSEVREQARPLCSDIEQVFRPPPKC